MSEYPKPKITIEQGVDYTRISLSVTDYVEEATLETMKRIDAVLAERMISMMQEAGYLAEHDREVAEKAWEEGAIAAWNRSGKQVYGDDYEELNFIPLSLRETNTYEKKGSGGK